MMRTLSHIGTALVFLPIASAAPALAGPCGTSLSSEAAAPLYPLPDGNHWGYVNRDGAWQSAPRWRQVRPFSEGRAAVESEDGWGVIDRDGAYVIEPATRDADRVVIGEETYALSPYKPAAQGCIAATPADGIPHYRTVEGTRWDPPGLSDHEVVDLGSFSEGLAWVRVANEDGGATGWIDTDGGWAIEPQFHDGGDFSEGRAPAAISNSNWGYIDQSGELVMPRKFILSKAGSYGNGLAPVALGGEAGYMDADNWALREINYPDGTTKPIRDAGPFSDGRAAVLEGETSRPRTIWIDSDGDVAFIPGDGRSYRVCDRARPEFYEGLLPLSVSLGGNICGKPPEIVREGPGDPRNGAERMLWQLPWERSRLVWLDQEGQKILDSSECRRPHGMEPLPTTVADGGLAKGAYRIELSGMAEGTFGPVRTDGPCNTSEYALDDSDGTNAAGPWRLSFEGAARWQERSVELYLDVILPEGLSTGTHEVGAETDDTAVSAHLRMIRGDDAEVGATQPDRYSSQSGTLTLSRLDREAASGDLELELASKDAPEQTISLSVNFHEIPYQFGPEFAMTEVTGSLARFDEETPDDPLENFFQPLEVTEAEDRLGILFGTFGPNLELSFPAGHSGRFTAGPDEAVSATLAGVPAEAEGTLSRVDGKLAGEVTAEIHAHPELDGRASVSVRFAHIPIEQPE